MAFAGGKNVTLFGIQIFQLGTRLKRERKEEVLLFCSTNRLDADFAPITSHHMHDIPHARLLTVRCKLMPPSCFQSNAPQPLLQARFHGHLGPPPGPAPLEFALGPMAISRDVVDSCGKSWRALEAWRRWVGQWSTLDASK